jgi:hypothetical protein
LTRALADDAGARRRIEDTFSDAYRRKPRPVEKADIELLRQLLEGLDDRLVGTFVDEHWNGPTDRIPELKRRTMLEIDDIPARCTGGLGGVAESDACVANPDAHRGHSGCSIPRDALDDHSRDGGMWWWRWRR